jgi:hypothetical protein
VAAEAKQPKKGRQGRPDNQVLSGYGKAISAVGRDVPAAYRPSSNKTRRGRTRSSYAGFFSFFDTFSKDLEELAEGWALKKFFL